MPTPRVTIDQLPEQGVLEDTNLFIIQDDGVSKKASVAALRALPSTALTDHIADTTGAHAATAISATDSGGGINGTDVQSQLGQLSTALGSRLTQATADPLYVNVAGDTVTGPLNVPAPTADAHAATKKYVDDALIAAGNFTPLDSWPVGSIFITIVATNPSTLLGGGTWIEFAQGRMLMGLNPSDTTMDTAEEVGGAASTTLTTAHMPQHAHTMAHTHAIDHNHPVATSAANNVDHTHTINHDHPSVTTDNPGHHTHAAGGTGSHFLELVGTGGTYARAAGTGTIAYATTGSEGGHTHTVNLPSFTGNSGVNSADHTHTVDVPAFTGASGASSAANTGNAGTASPTPVPTIPPFIVTYMWKRTA